MLPYVLLTEIRYVVRIGLHGDKADTPHSDAPRGHFVTITSSFRSVLLLWYFSYALGLSSRPTEPGTLKFWLPPNKTAASLEPGISRG